MVNSPLVSVIMPSYNHKVYVEDAIKSVVAQTFKDFELIVLDDGSSDGSDVVLRELSVKYGFKLYEGRNGGLCRTLNKGLDCSVGKYIALIASDDVWVHDKLEKQVAFMEANPEVLACSGNHVKITSDGCPLPFYKQRFHAASMLGFKEIFLWEGTLAGPLAMIRSKSLHDISGYDEQCAVEDWDVWLRLTNTGRKIYRMAEVLGFYRVHSDNTYSNISITEPSLLYSAKKFKNHALYKKAVKKIYVRSFSILSSAERLRALRYLFKACSLDFNFLKGLVKLFIPYHAK